MMENQNRVKIMRNLLLVTKDMLSRQNDEMFLIESVDKRQALIDQYDRVDNDESQPPLSPDELQAIKAAAHEIVRLDSKIMTVLDRHRNNAKAELAASNSQKRVLGYVNQAMSASGSYMDYKK